MTAITGSQIRMARAALRWRVNTLADNSGVNWARVQQMEKAEGVPSARAEVLEQIRKVFEDAGIVFIDAGEKGGPGVRLKVTPPPGAED